VPNSGCSRSVNETSVCQLDKSELANSDEIPGSSHHESQASFFRIAGRLVEELERAVGQVTLAGSRNRSESKGDAKASVAGTKIDDGSSSSV
jgi:hypothetical protein